MKKAIVRLSVALCLTLLSGNSFAQFIIPIYVPAPQKTNKQTLIRTTDMKNVGWDDSYTESMVSWESQKLTWSDFKGKKTAANDTTVYNMDFISRPYAKKEKIGHVTYRYTSCESLFNSATSWIEDSCKNFTMLKNCQTTFDIWELYSRKALREYNSVPDVSINEIYNFYDKLFYTRVAELKEATNNGRNREKVDEFAAEVSEQLTTTKFNPETVVSALKEHHGYYLELGALSNISLTTLGSPAFGMVVGAGYFKNKFMIGGEIDIEGGTFRRDVFAKKGKIYNGDNMFAGNIGTVCGYRTIRNKAVELTPYFGIGGRFCEGGILDEQYQTNKKGNNKVSCGGVSLGIGCMIDIALHRTVDIKVNSDDITRDTHNLRIKPYFNITNYNNGIGWVPALNISLSWALTTITLK